MKTLKKISLAYALQVFGVIMLFGYPGCSSNIKETKEGAGENDITTKKSPAVQEQTKKTPAPATSFSGHQQQPVQVNLASYLDFSK